MKRTKMDDRGMTMTEVLVGFVILSIIMAGVYHLINFGSNMMFESMDQRRGQMQFEEAVYKSSPPDTVTEKKDEGTLAAGVYVLEPANDAAKAAGQGSYTATRIGLFTSTDSENKLYSYTYNGEYKDNFGIRVYGFEK